MTIKAAFFDVDGTLVDSIEDIHIAINSGLEDNALNPISADETRRFVGKGAHVLVEKALLSQSADIGSFAEKVFASYMRALLKNGTHFTKAFDTVLESLKLLKAAGIKLAVVTNKEKGPTIDCLNTLGLLSFFDTVINPSDVQNPKPAGDMVVLAAEKLNVNLSECVMVGDSMNDAIAAKNGGCQALLVKTGYNEGIPIEQWAKHYETHPLVFDQMSGVAQYILAAR